MFNIWVFTVLVLGCVLRDLGFSADEAIKLSGRNKQAGRLWRVAGDGMERVNGAKILTKF